MRKYSVFLASMLFFLACGGDSDPSPNKGTASQKERTSLQNQNSNVAVTAADPAPANAVNAEDNPLTVARNKKIEAMRQAGADPSIPKPDIETVLRQSTRPAPENSEFSVALTDILVERRTFLKNPTIAKVEKTTAGGKKSIKVFLKDGRTLDLPGEAIESLATAASTSILKAAGIPQADRPDGPEVKTKAPVKN